MFYAASVNKSVPITNPYSRASDILIMGLSRAYLTDSI
jgi:hypothetical protein